MIAPARCGAPPVRGKGARSRPLEGCHPVDPLLPACFSGRQAIRKEGYMSRQLSSGSSLETLRKEAKRWLKAIRAGDARAMERYQLATDNAARADASSIGLRDVQMALAREYGLPGWSAL